MSRILEDRVWQAHPLAPQYRCVLLHIAKEVPTAASEVLVTRTLVAKALDTTGELVGKALVAAEQINLCRILKNGRVAFTCYDGAIGADQPPVRVGGVADAPPAPDVPVGPPPPTVKDVLFAFGTIWRERYNRIYPFKPGRDHKLANDLRHVATLDEITRAARAYLDSDDPFLFETAHGFVTFSAQFHKYVVAGAPRQKTVSDADRRAIARARQMLTPHDAQSR